MTEQNEALVTLFKAQGIRDGKISTMSNSAEDWIRIEPVVSAFWPHTPECAHDNNDQADTGSNEDCLNSAFRRAFKVDGTQPARWVLSRDEEDNLHMLSVSLHTDLKSMTVDVTIGLAKTGPQADAGAASFRWPAPVSHPRKIPPTLEDRLYAKLEALRSNESWCDSMALFDKNPTLEILAPEAIKQLGRSSPDMPWLSVRAAHVLAASPTRILTLGGGDRSWRIVAPVLSPYFAHSEGCGQKGSDTWDACDYAQCKRRVLREKVSHPGKAIWQINSEMPGTMNVLTLSRRDQDVGQDPWTSIRVVTDTSRSDDVAESTTGDWSGDLETRQRDFSQWISSDPGVHSSNTYHLAKKAGMDAVLSTFTRISLDFADQCVALLEEDTITKAVS